MPECASKGRASSEHGQAIRELSDKKRRARLPGLGLLLQRTFREPPGAPADARTPSSERACFLVVASSAEASSRLALPMAPAANAQRRGQVLRINVERAGRDCGELARPALRLL